MEVKIKFTSVIYIEADSEEEAMEQFEEMPIFSVEALDCYAEIEDSEVEKD